MTKEADTKSAIPGSLEAFQEEMREAVAAQGLIPGGFQIVATLPDSVIVCVYGMNGSRHYSIGYTVQNGTIALGAMSPVDLETVVVPEGAEAPVEPPAEMAAEEPMAGDGMDMEEMAVEEPAAEGEYEEFSGVDDLEYKSFDIKGASEGQTVNGVKGWTFEGYASVWDVEDHERDVTRKGAFARTLAEGTPLVKYEHGPTVGVVLDAKEDDHGLYVKGFIPEDNSTDFMRKLMKIGAVSKMSYGWKPYPGGFKRNPDGVRELTEIKLYEVSPVAIPMLDATSITSVKSLPNGLPDAPFDVQMGAAGAALLAAKDEAEALMKRRERQRNGQIEWAISEKNLAAIAELGSASAETLAACLLAEVKAGRAVSNTRKRYLAALVQSLMAFVDSLPENERTDLSGLLDGEGDSGDGESKTAVPATGSANGREVVVRDLVADYLESQLTRFTG